MAFFKTRQTNVQLTSWFKNYLLLVLRSRNSVVGIVGKIRAEGYGVRFRTHEGNFSHLQKTESGSGPHPASY